MAANPSPGKTSPPPYPPPPYQAQQPPYPAYAYPGAPYPAGESQQPPVVASPPPNLPTYAVTLPPPNTYNYGATRGFIPALGPAFVVAAPPLGPQSTQVYCPTCHVMVFSQTSYESGFLAWICCFFIFILGGVWGCCLIPFCIESCQDVYHKCPNCQTILGVYSRH